MDKLKTSGRTSSGFVDGTNVGTGLNRAKSASLSALESSDSFKTVIEKSLNPSPIAKSLDAFPPARVITAVEQSPLSRSLDTSLTHLLSRPQIPNLSPPVPLVPNVIVPPHPFVPSILSRAPGSQRLFSRVGNFDSTRFTNPLENLGTDITRESVRRVVAETGKGTTTTKVQDVKRILRGFFSLSKVRDLPDVDSTKRVGVLLEKTHVKENFRLSFIKALGTGQEADIVKALEDFDVLLRVGVENVDLKTLLTKLDKEKFQHIGSFKDTKQYGKIADLIEIFAEVRDKMTSSTLEKLNLFYKKHKTPIKVGAGITALGAGVGIGYGVGVTVEDVNYAYEKITALKEKFVKLVDNNYDGLVDNFKLIKNDLSELLGINITISGDLLSFEKVGEIKEKFLNLKKNSFDFFTRVASIKEDLSELFGANVTFSFPADDDSVVAPNPPTNDDDSVVTPNPPTPNPPTNDGFAPTPTINDSVTDDSIDFGNDLVIDDLIGFDNSSTIEQTTEDNDDNLSVEELEKEIDDLLDALLEDVVYKPLPELPNNSVDNSPNDPNIKNKRDADETAQIFYNLFPTNDGFIKTDDENVVSCASINISIVYILLSVHVFLMCQ